MKVRTIRSDEARSILYDLDGTIWDSVLFLRQQKELFLELTRKKAEQFERLFEEWIEVELNEPSVVASNEHAMMEFFLNNMEAFILLAEKAAGTSYEGYAERCLERFTDGCYRL